MRFAWKTDAEGRFNAISDEFAAVVGVPAADLIGRSFKEVAQSLGLDAQGEIAGLLERRDTWSGRSVLWPVAGTDLRIPVDLAALPVYDRDRKFSGFRGFGVARAGDAIVDPEATGLALAKIQPANDAGAGEAAASDVPEIAATSDTGSAQDPFKGEVPVLSIVPKQERRFSDKVIRLAEHRPANGEKGLSPGERVAFREIGDRLKKESGVAEQAPASLRGDNDQTPPPAGAIPAQRSTSNPTGRNRRSARVRCCAEVELRRRGERAGGRRCSGGSRPAKRTDDLSAAANDGDAKSDIVETRMPRARCRQ